jgi:hypothetical protein
MAVSGKRRKTVKRKVYGQVAESGDFGERLYAVFREHGLSSDEPVHVVADGAAWIRNVRSMVFPRGRYTLDLYHLKERASSVLVEHQQEEFLEYVYRGKPRDGLEYLRTLSGSDRRHKVELEDFVRYVEDNLSGMKYRSGDIKGSGVIEKMADLVVKKRMKRQGMTWSKAGANNILVLRSIHLNNLEKKRNRSVRPLSSPHSFQYATSTSSLLDFSSEFP